MPFSFENFGAYVLDVGWSPVHPGLFSAVDLTGRVSFWNLNSDTEVSSNNLLKVEHFRNGYKLSCLRKLVPFLTKIVGANSVIYAPRRVGSSKLSSMAPIWFYGGDWISKWARYGNGAW